jgi:mono/diheme cytochrome c family protein
MRVRIHLRRLGAALRPAWPGSVVIAVCAVLALPLIRPPAAAAQALPPDSGGDVSTGLRLAQAWCAECHAVESKAPRRGKAVPDFAEIANRASTTALSLNVFFRSNHNAMPNFVIQQNEADHLAAYILSLKGR